MGRTPWSRAGGLAVIAVALLVVCVLSVWLGARQISPLETLQALWQPDGSIEATVIRQYRVPRTLVGLLAGTGLGMAGVLMQSLTRNPLADPGLLGVTLGASAAVVAAIAFAGVAALSGYVWFALAGAAGAASLTYLLGRGGRGAVASDRIVLAGAAISAMLAAFVSAVLLQRTDAFQTFRYWDVGSIAGRDMTIVQQVAPFIGAGVLIALLVARPLNVLALGDETGRALGAAPGRTRLWAAVAITLLCGAATAAAGPIGFVGLIIAHVTRLLAGPDLRWALPYAALLAPVLLLGSDVAGRLVAAPSELAVGLVTALAGAPVFIALCRRRRLAL
ncbi:FecCD family ABC transporter permease [Longispora albida]|uniref:FecCD family ABC transporter permease n=1 Tax=Longispora albida TaxID=203523 RepID=UPI000371EB5A|nr:iron chelate uptake ABC transporter family permease subunit [Longispora albida]